MKRGRDDAPDPAAAAAWPALDPDAHKGRAGRVAALVGSASMPGAALLVARAAQRAGAGLVLMQCVDRSLLDLLPSAVPEAVWSDVSAAFGGDGHGDPGAAGARLAERTPHARVAGCGLGDDLRTRSVLRALLALDEGVPLVLDADALNAAADDPAALTRARGSLVLTPHPGEAERLLGRDVPGDERGRAEAARTLARTTGAVVCLKGRRTVVTDGERLVVNDTGCEAMATAGSGDVLAGIAAAYLARARAAGRELDVLATVALAVRLHGLAGERAAAELGTDAVVASDLIEHLPAVQRAFRAGGGAAGPGAARGAPAG